MSRVLEESAGGAITGDIAHTGTKVGLYSVDPVTRSVSFTMTNDTADRIFDANNCTPNEMADVVVTLARDIARLGAIGAIA